MGKINLFLSQNNHKAADETLGKCFLKELKAECKISIEKQQKENQKVR